MIIKIFVVTKNEYDLIEDWTNFYGRIFDYSNLTIIDTGSNNLDVLMFYEEAKKMGVNVIVDIGYEGNSQGEKFTKYMLMEKEKNESDFLLGCDTDNFLFIKNVNKIKKEDYFNYFNSLPDDKNKFLIHSSLDSIPTLNSNYINNKYKRPVLDTEQFFNHASVCINFYRTKNFIKTENGNHSGITFPNHNAHLTNLSMVHYNNTGINRLQERSLEICIGYKHFEINYPFNHENCKKNYKNIYRFFSEKQYGCGIHRSLQAFSFLLRHYIFSLFEKYASDYFNLILFYNVLYSNKNILNNEPCEKIITSFPEEYAFASSGDLKFVNYKLQYSPENMEKDFINFFKKNISKTKKITMSDIFDHDELLFCDSVSKQFSCSKDTRIKDFLF